MTLQNDARISITSSEHPKIFFFSKAQQHCRIQQTLLQKPDEDLYIVNLIAEGAC